MSFFAFLLIILIVIPSVSAENSNNIDLINDDFSSDLENSIEISSNALDDSLNIVADSDFGSVSNSGLEENLISDSNIDCENDESINIRSEELKNRINNAEENEVILIEPGLYKMSKMNLTKNITLQGNGNPRDIIIDGDFSGSVFLINSPSVTARFNNLTIMNGLTFNFGGAICIETGNVYVDNCIFVNNTALARTNGGAISNYGNKYNRSYLFVNNSLFLGNFANHDGGAVTTCYASSDIINSVFINNSAVRDGGAIRVSVFGYGRVQDCVFMYNHADEWGGAYYSWAGNSTIDRCIFLNNTAGTNGGAVMVSGSLNLTNSLIMNNEAGETGGSFYIQQPMFDAKTKIKVNNNIITNNSSPLGKEIFLSWEDVYNLFPNFNNNDWGDEDPTDSDVVDPNNVSNRIKPNTTQTIRNLTNILRFDLLSRYSDILNDYYLPKSEDYSYLSSYGENKNENDLNDQFDDLFKKKDKNSNTNPFNEGNKSFNGFYPLNNTNSNLTGVKSKNKSYDINSSYVSSFSRDNLKMVEIVEDNPIALKSFDIRYLIVLVIVTSIFLIGLSRKRKRN